MATFINPEWESTVKQVDPNFEGSVWQKLGLSAVLCPTCNAHCKMSDGELICLNACHLIPEAQERFHQFWLLITKITDIENVILKYKE